ncbi:response regulator [Rhodocaloribacter litoris]|uniref:response regulator n=1 Tax=Rhodocaloribacter litoris TaxID=2558931 RepID=UPI001422E6D5|nr:response regulator [Rhodocaloribacter litoris]QXD16273.1 response regulator [Rhodocaloribacter litoris]
MDAPADRSEPSGYDILVVDDNAEMRAYIRHCLRDFEGGGHRIREAADGQEALDALAGHPCDLVITDVVMPRMDGLTLGRLVSEHYPGVPVLFITGEAPADARRRAARLATGTVLPKPFNGRKLCRALDHLLHPHS